MVLLDIDPIWAMLSATSTEHLPPPELNAHSFVLVSLKPMGMLVHIAVWGAQVLLFFTIGIVVWKILARRIPLGGILTGELRDGRAYFSIGRLQLLICVVVVALNYVIAMMARGTRSNLPDIHLLWVALMGASAVVYLAEKAWALLLSRNDLGSYERGTGNGQ